LSSEPLVPNQLLEQQSILMDQLSEQRHHLQILDDCIMDLNLQRQQMQLDIRNLQNTVAAGAVTGVKSSRNLTTTSRARQGGGL
jgi:hypothetical protein